MIEPLLKQPKKKGTVPQKGGNPLFLFLVLSVALGSFPGPAWPMAKRPPAQPGTQRNASLSLSLSLTLEECFERAKKRSETLAIKEEAVKETTAQFLKATSEALGDVDFEMTRQLQQETAASDSSSVGRGLADPARPQG